MREIHLTPEELGYGPEDSSPTQVEVKFADYLTLIQDELGNLRIEVVPVDGDIVTVIKFDANGYFVSHTMESVD